MQFAVVYYIRSTPPLNAYNASANFALSTPFNFKTISLCAKNNVRFCAIVGVLWCSQVNKRETVALAMLEITAPLSRLEFFSKKSAEN